MDALHLYCVVAGNGSGAPHAFAGRGAPTGLNGRPVFSVGHRELAALVSPAPVRAYKAMTRDEIVPHLAAHQAVIEAVLGERAVVPVKFGTMARNEEEVQRILARGYPQLRAALLAVEGTIELDLVARWRDLGLLFRQIGEEPEIRRKKAIIAVRPPQETGEERIRLGQMVKARLDELRDQLGAEIIEALRPLCHDLCPHALLDDATILNTAFLVDRAREGEVDQTLERLNDRYTDRVDFRCVGPLPPYSFCTVEVKTFDVDVIDRARRLLGLGEEAGAAEIRDAYRRLIQERHPDRAYQGGGAAGRDAAGPFHAVTEAYRQLGEYRLVGSSFRPRDVSEAVAVRLFQWAREPGGA